MIEKERNSENLSGSQRREALIAVLLIAPIPSIGIIAGMISPAGSLGHSLFVACKIWLLLLPGLWWLWRESGRLRWVAPRKEPLLFGGLLDSGFPHLL